MFSKDTFHQLPHSTEYNGYLSRGTVARRHPRCRLDLLKLHTAEKVERSQIKQKEQHGSMSRKRKLNVGDNVFVKNYHHGDKGLPGVIPKKTGPVSFVVKFTDGRVHRCQQDQVCSHFMEVYLDCSAESEVSVSLTEVSLPRNLLPKLLFTHQGVMLKGQMPWTPVWLLRIQ